MVRAANSKLARRGFEPHRDRFIKEVVMVIRPTRINSRQISHDLDTTEEIEYVLWDPATGAESSRKENVVKQIGLDDLLKKMLKRIDELEHAIAEYGLLIAPTEDD